MELLIEYKAEKQHSLVEELTTSKERIMCTIGRDFYKSVANINGLISLLNDGSAADPDFKQIHSYLSKEASKLQSMVKEICA